MHAQVVIAFASAQRLAASVPRQNGVTHRIHQGLKGLPMRMLRTLTRLAPVIAATILFLAGCGINTIPTQDEATKTAWAEVQNQYQRRADLIPNLVATVKGYAAQEKGVLVEVTQARASATQVKVDASTITDPAQFQALRRRPGQAVGRAGPADDDPGELSGPEVEPELPGPAEPAGGHREPHLDRPARLQQHRPGLQHRRCAPSPASIWAKTPCTPARSRPSCSRPRPTPSRRPRIDFGAPPAPSANTQPGPAN